MRLLQKCMNTLIPLDNKIISMLENVHSLIKKLNLTLDINMGKKLKPSTTYKKKKSYSTQFLESNHNISYQYFISRPAVALTKARANPYVLI